MPWRQSSGRDVCNDCRKRLDLGAALYVGARTPATWCETCAESSLGVTLGDAQDVPRHLPVATGLVGLSQLVAKFAPKVRANWGEGE